jgi:hypothetical protein
MLEVTDTIVEFLVNECVNENQIDEVIDEIVKWRREDKQRKAAELDTTRAAVLDKLRDYYKALIGRMGGVCSEAQVDTFIKTLSQEMREAEGEIGATIQQATAKASTLKPAAKSDEDQLNDFLKKLMK